MHGVRDDALAARLGEDTETAKSEHCLAIERVAALSHAPPFARIPTSCRPSTLNSQGTAVQRLLAATKRSLKLGRSRRLGRLLWAAEATVALGGSGPRTRQAASSKFELAVPTHSGPSNSPEAAVGFSVAVAQRFGSAAGRAEYRPQQPVAQRPRSLPRWAAARSCYEFPFARLMSIGQLLATHRAPRELNDSRVF